MSLSYIDLFLKNCLKSFQSPFPIETGLSDFHKLIATVLKVKHENVPAKIAQYRNFKILTRQDFLKIFK